MNLFRTTNYFFRVVFEAFKMLLAVILCWFLPHDQMHRPMLFLHKATIDRRIKEAPLRAEAIRALKHSYSGYRRRINAASGTYRRAAAAAYDGALAYLEDLSHEKC